MRPVRWVPWTWPRRGHGRPSTGPRAGPATARPAGRPQGYQQQPRQQQWQGPDPRYGRDQYGQGQDQYGQDPWNGQQGQQPRQPQQPSGGPGYDRRPGYGQEQRDGQQAPGARQQQPGGRHADPAGRSRAAAGDAATDPAVAADRRLSAITLGRAVSIGAAQILALLPGISRDGIVTVAGMGRGLRREDAVRFSFLLSAPVILAAGVLKTGDLTGPASKGMHGPIIAGSLIAGIGAYLSIRFLTKYFSEDKSLNPFGYYCIIAGLGSLAYLVLR